MEIFASLPEVIMKHQILALFTLLALSACGGGGGGGGGEVTLTTGADGRVGNIPSTVTVLPTANNQ
jgi:ABC-type methionine transport system permease subunit